MEPPGRRIPLPSHFPKDGSNSSSHDESGSRNVQDEDDGSMLVSKEAEEEEVTPITSFLPEVDSEHNGKISRGLGRTVLEREAKAACNKRFKEKSGKTGHNNYHNKSPPTTKAEPEIKLRLRGLQRTSADLEEKDRARANRRQHKGSVVIGALNLSDAIIATNKNLERGLHRTSDERNAKLLQKRNRSSTTLPQSQSPPQQQKLSRGLGRTAEELQAKNQCRNNGNGHLRMDQMHTTAGSDSLARQSVHDSTFQQVDLVNSEGSASTDDADITGSLLEPDIMDESWYSNSNFESLSQLQDEELPARIQPTQEENLVQARLVAEESNAHLTQAQMVDLEAEAQRAQNRKASRKKQTVLGLILVVLFVGGLSLGLIFGLQQWGSPGLDNINNTLVPTSSPTISFTPTIAPSNAPSMLAFQFQVSLPNFTQQSLRDRDSPQSKALDFVLDHPEFETMEATRRLQLFALATFYHAFHGTSWPLGIDKNWMNPERHECDWFSSIFGDIKLDDGGSGDFVYVESQDPFAKIVSDWCGGSPCRDKEFRCLVFSNIAGGLIQGAMMPVMPAEMMLLTSLDVVALPENSMHADLNQILPPALSSLKIFSLPDNKNVSGTIPSHIADFQELFFLDLLGNKISGTLPTEIGLVTTLSTLVLSENNLTGPVPSEIVLLSNLFRLQLDRNQFEFPLPSQIYSLTGLDTLAIDADVVGGSLPPGLQALSNTNIDIYGQVTQGMSGFPVELLSQTNLESIDLTSQQLTGTLPSELGLLTALKTLILSTNQLTGSIPSQLGLLTKLDSLFVDNNMMTGSIPSELGLLSHMALFDLSFNSLSGTIPFELGGQRCDFDNLGPFSCYPFQVMFLQDNLISGSIPSEMGLLHRAIAINLSNNNVSSAIPTELGSLDNLVYLRLHLNSLTGTIPSELGLVDGHPRLGGLLPASPFAYISLANNSLTGTVPVELGTSASNNSLKVFLASGNRLSGMIPGDLCYLQDPDCDFYLAESDTENPAAYKCQLLFDCTNTLCGCDCGCP